HSTSRMSVSNYLTYEWTWLITAGLERAVTFSQGAGPTLLGLPIAADSNSGAIAINDNGAIAGDARLAGGGQGFLQTGGNIYPVTGLVLGLNNLEHMVLSGATLWVNDPNLSADDRYL